MKKTRSEKWQAFKQYWIWKYFFYPITFFIIAIIAVVFMLTFRFVEVLIDFIIDKFNKWNKARKERRQIMKEVDQAILEMEDQIIQGLKTNLKNISENEKMD